MKRWVNMTYFTIYESLKRQSNAVLSALFLRKDPFTPLILTPIAGRFPFITAVYGSFSSGL